MSVPTSVPPTTPPSTVTPGYTQDIPPRPLGHFRDPHVHERPTTDGSVRSEATPFRGELNTGRSIRLQFHRVGVFSRSTLESPEGARSVPVPSRSPAVIRLPTRILSITLGHNSAKYQAKNRMLSGTRPMCGDVDSGEQTGTETDKNLRLIA